MKLTIPRTSVSAYTRSVTAVPSVFSVIRSALRDGWPLLKRNAIGAVVLAIIGIALDVVTTQTPLRSGVNNASLVAQTLLAFAFTYFGATAATRTINPAYGMSASGFVSFVALLAAVVLLTAVGLAALIVPGFWLLGKLWPAPYALLLGSKRPFNDSWRATTGAYWKTLGILVLVFVLNVAVALLSVKLTQLCADHPILVSPAYVVYWFVLLWSLFVGALANVRWAHALLSRRGLIEGTSAW
jgi:hypothetical protein